jgi:ankyrin repeat protein
VVRGIGYRGGSLAVVSLVFSSIVLSGADPDRRLADAARRRDIKTVQRLIKEGVDANTPQGDGATALHWAAHWDDVALADLLIAARANASAADDSGVVPLNLAATNGNAAMVGRLLKGGANPNAGRESPVMTAARTGSPDVMKLLLDAGGNANARETARGQTALMWAASERHPQIVKLLLDRGADANARTIVSAPAGRGMRGGGAAAGAAAGGRGGNAAAGAGRGAQDGGAAAAAALGTDAQAANNTGFTRGGGSGANGFTPLLFAARVGDLETTRILVGAGANVNDMAADGTSALILAALRGYPAIATFLVEQGADANADRLGFTALHWAAGSWETELTVTSITPAREGEWATVGGLKDGRLELVKTLLAHGANPNAIIRRTPTRVGSSKNPGLPELEGATPLVVAAMAGATDVMRVLLDHGADAHVRTRGRGTPLMAAAGLGRAIGEILVPEKDTLAAAKMVLELGDADINAVDVVGNTALHYAAFLRRDSIVQLLVDHGASLEVPNVFGETPLWLAEVVIQFAGGGRYEVGKTSTGDLLRRLGAKPIAAPYKLRSLYWPYIPHV